MSVNYASKYSPNVDERFYKEALSTPATNQDYEWLGVNAVKVYSIPIVPMGDYTSSGTSRYGEVDELGNSVQTLTLTKDRAFTFSIDRSSYDDTMMTMEAGKALSREINEVAIPEIDHYRFEKIAFGAGAYDTTTATKSNIYELFLGMNAVLDNNAVPVGGRIAFLTPKLYNYLKLDSSFVKSGDSSLQVSYKGFVGEVDGVAIVKVPETRMPVGCSMIIAHNSATVAPVKLEDYRIHENPVGVNGWVIEGRFRYDAFVLSNKAVGIVANTTASTTYTITFDGNSESSGITPQAVVGFSGGTFLAPTCNLVKSSKTFKEWNTSADGTGTTYAVGATITVSADTTLYAIYNS